MVICTREEERNVPLIEACVQRGLQAVSLPLIKTEPLPLGLADRAVIGSALDDPEAVICWSSPTAVRLGVAAFPELLTAHRTALRRCGIAVPGEGTGSEWRSIAGYSPTVIASAPTGSDLAQTILERCPPFRRAVLIGPQSPRPELAETLEAGKLSVSQIVVYRTIPQEVSPESIEWFASLSQNVILFCSPSAVNAFMQSGLFRRGGPVCCAAFGPSTAAAARRFGSEVVVEHARGSIDGFVEEVAAWVRVRQGERDQ